MALNVTGVPTVEPQAGSSPYQNIQPSPQDFGGFTAAGLQRLGQGADQAGGNLADIAILGQQRHNQIANDEAVNQTQSWIIDKTYGKGGIFGMSGSDAMNALPVFKNDVENYRKQVMAGLQNDAQRLAYDRDSRRLITFTMEAVGRHVDAQSKVWAKGTSDATVDNSIRAIGLGYNDDQNYKNNLSQALVGAFKGAQTEYGNNPGPEIWGKIKSQVEEKAIETRALAWAETNPAAAQAWLDTQRGKVEPAKYDALEKHIKVKADNESVAFNIQDILNGGTGATVHPTANNVGNMRASGGGWQTFATPEDGVAAAVSNLQGYADRFGGQVTLSQAINTWAPKGDGSNDPDEYIRTITQQTGIQPNQPLPLDDPAKMAGLIKVMNSVEKGGAQFDDGVYLRGAQAAVTGRGALRDSMIPSQFMDSAAMIAEAYRRAEGMSPEAGLKLIRGVQVQIAKNDALNSRAQAAAEKARKDAEEDAKAGIVRGIARDPVGFDPNNITNNAALSAEDMKDLLKFQQEWRDRPYGSTESKIVANQLLGRMRLDPNDPRRITTMDPIYQEKVNGHLSNADFEFLQGQLATARTPEGQSIKETKDEFLKGMEKSIDQSNPLLGKIDMSGGRQFYAFQRMVEKKILDYQKAQKDPSTLFDPGSPDYLGTDEVLAPFQKNISQSAEDARRAAAVGASLPPAAPQVRGAPALPPARTDTAAPGQTPPAAHGGKTLDDFFGGFGRQ